MSRPDRRLPSVAEPLGKLRSLLGVPRYRRLALRIGLVYLVLFLIALRDVSLGGRGFGVQTVE